MTGLDGVDTATNIVRWIEATNRNISKLATIAELQNQHLSRIRTMTAITLGIVIGAAISQAIFR
jgi:hypothetical protein